MFVCSHGTGTCAGPLVFSANIWLALSRFPLPRARDWEVLGGHWTVFFPCNYFLKSPPSHCQWGPDVSTLHVIWLETLGSEQVSPAGKICSRKLRRVIAVIFEMEMKQGRGKPGSQVLSGFLECELTAAWDSCHCSLRTNLVWKTRRARNGWSFGVVLTYTAVINIGVHFQALVALDWNENIYPFYSTCFNSGHEVSWIISQVTWVRDRVHPAGTVGSHWPGAHTVLTTNHSHSHLRTICSLKKHDGRSCFWNVGANQITQRKNMHAWQDHANSTPKSKFKPNISQLRRRRASHDEPNWQESFDKQNYSYASKETVDWKYVRISSLL